MRQLFRFTASTNCNLHMLLNIQAKVCIYTGQNDFRHTGTTKPINCWNAMYAITKTNYIDTGQKAEVSRVDSQSKCWSPFWSPFKKAPLHGDDVRSARLCEGHPSDCHLKMEHISSSPSLYIRHRTVRDQQFLRYEQFATSVTRECT